MNKDTLQQNWAECMKVLRDNVGEDTFGTWFACAMPVSFDNGDLVVKLPSKFYVDLYENKFFNVVSKAIFRVFGPNVHTIYEYDVIGGDKSSTVKIAAPSQSHALTNPIARQKNVGAPDKRGEDFDPQLNPALNFENYCVGNSNRLAYTIAEHIANHPEKPDFNPFFLYGDVGVGKTHLIQAIGIRIKEKNPRARVLFISMRHFQNLYQQSSIITKDIPQFINWYNSMDCILFDDLQELSNKRGTAETLFPIFNYLHQNNKKLIFTCDRPPQELDGIEDRLIDRFKWGITEPLPAPDFELRKKILHFKASQNGLDLSDEIIDAIARHCDSSVRELEGIVMGLYTRAIVNNVPITLSLAEEVISHLVKTPAKKVINFDMIVENTAEYYKLNPEVIFKKCRTQNISDARQMIMYLCKKHTNLSSPAIGSMLNRSHATVLHGIKAVEDRMEFNHELADTIAAIEKALLS